eukprot:UN0588
MLGIFGGGESGSESGSDDEGGCSKARLCFGLCGVLPSIIWLGVLAYLYVSSDDLHCDAPDHIGLFIKLSIAGFAVIVGVEFVEGCYAGEPDFKMSALEIGTFCIQATAAVFVYVWNYYGVIQLVGETNCDRGLRSAGWVTLVGNNIIWFLTLATTIGSQVMHVGFAGADKALGDRL